MNNNLISKLKHTACLLIISVAFLSSQSYAISRYSMTFSGLIDIDICSFGDCTGNDHMFEELGFSDQQLLSFDWNVEFDEDDFDEQHKKQQGWDDPFAFGHLDAKMKGGYYGTGELGDAEEASGVSKDFGGSGSVIHLFDGGYWGNFIYGQADMSATWEVGKPNPLLSQYSLWSFYGLTRAFDDQWQIQMQGNLLLTSIQKIAAVTETPIPAAIWLMTPGLALFGYCRRKNRI